MIFPVIGQALVEGSVFLSGNVTGITRPNRLGLVELFFRDFLLLDLLGLLLFGLVFLIFNFLDLGFIFLVLYLLFLVIFNILYRNDQRAVRD